MARKLPHGQRFKYVLDDGSKWDIYEAMDEMKRLHDQDVSESLMYVRLSCTEKGSDPKYVFQAKGTIVEGGQPYCKKNKARTKNPQAFKVKTMPKKKTVVKVIIRSAKELALIKACKAIGIGY